MQTKGKQQSESVSMEPAGKKNSPPAFLRIILILGLLAAGAFFAWRFFYQPARGLLHVSGRLEGYETNIGAKIGGRVDYIKYREGALVKTGELIVKISDDDIQAQLRGAEARLKQAHRQQDQSEAQVAVARTQIEQGQLTVDQSKEDVQGRVFQAQANVAQAQAQLSQAVAQLQEAESDLQLAGIRKDRYGRLVAKGAVTQDQDDQAATTYNTALATVDARKSAVEASKKQLHAQEGLLQQALATKLNPPIRAAELAGYKRQLESAEAQLRAAKQSVANALAARQEVEANIAYLNIPSPIDGIVTARPVEPGAVVVAGQTVLSLIDLTQVYLRGYIPEGDIGRVRVQQKARVYLDSAPNKPLDGTVIEIDPVASFTPENIYFRDDRVKQVFGIKIKITNPANYCKPGMPADADIITAE